mmetsp:Transcript_89382/g.286403  ORF Transcript_89382/g.286403 Transcript_89382/m.286403 type:complete len:356 (+) Transcript_89382:1309-2376(+)
MITLLQNSWQVWHCCSNSSLLGRLPSLRRQRNCTSGCGCLKPRSRSSLCRSGRHRAEKSSRPLGGPRFRSSCRSGRPTSPGGKPIVRIWTSRNGTSSLAKNPSLRRRPRTACASRRRSRRSSPKRRSASTRASWGSWLGRRRPSALSRPKSRGRRSSRSVSAASVMSRPRVRAPLRVRRCCWPRRQRSSNSVCAWPWPRSWLCRLRRCKTLPPWPIMVQALQPTRPHRARRLCTPSSRPCGAPRRSLPSRRRRPPLQQRSRPWRQQGVRSARRKAPGRGAPARRAVRPPSQGSGRRSARRSGRCSSSPPCANRARRPPRARRKRPTLRSKSTPKRRNAPRLSWRKRGAFLRPWRS